MKAKPESVAVRLMSRSEVTARSAGRNHNR